MSSLSTIQASSLIVRPFSLSLLFVFLPFQLLSLFHRAAMADTEMTAVAAVAISDFVRLIRILTLRLRALQRFCLYLTEPTAGDRIIVVPVPQAALSSSSLCACLLLDNAGTATTYSAHICISSAFSSFISLLDSSTGNLCEADLNPHSEDHLLLPLLRFIAGSADLSSHSSSCCCPYILI